MIAETISDIFTDFQNRLEVERAVEEVVPGLAA